MRVTGIQNHKRLEMAEASLFMTSIFLQVQGCSVLHLAIFVFIVLKK